MAEITMVSGDTLKLNIDRIVTSGGTEYRLSENDVIKMDVRKYPTDTAPVFSKTVTAADYTDDGKIPIAINPDDTAGKTGEYLFDIRLIMSGTEIYTIIPQSKLRIVQNITEVS